MPAAGQAAQTAARGAAIKVEVLCIPDCPNCSRAVERVREALSRLKVHVQITQVIVADAAGAARLRFPGSPTVRVNDRDVEPLPLSRESPALQCRLYPNSDNPGVPRREALFQALCEALQEGGRLKEQAKWAAPIAAVLTALATLACCLPLGFLAALGTAGAGLFFAKYRLWFLALSPIFLAIGFWQHYRAKSCNLRAHRISGILLWIATVAVLSLFLFPQWIAWLLIGGGR